jgi:hypothetical protein
MLVGSVAGIIAVLRVDPTEASMIFRLRRLGDGGWTVTFGAAQGLLTYWVVQAEQLVVLLDLTWRDDQPQEMACPGLDGRDRPRHHRGLPKRRLVATQRAGSWREERAICQRSAVYSS